MSKKRSILITALIISLSALLTVSCNKEDAVAPIQSDISASADAAESTASAVGEDNGGAVDQIGDLLELTNGNSPAALGKSFGAETVDASYDSINGVWTIEMFRERGTAGSVPYAMISRTYQVQFLNANGMPQKFYITGSDTARTINFDILQGSGRHITRRLSQQLNELTASFVATNTHQRNITLNGTYRRSAVDTVTTRRLVRTLDHTIDLTFIDVVGPRGSRRDLSRKISGTVQGTYDAFATFTSGNGYRERTIHRDILIVFGRTEGVAEIDVDGQKYRADIRSGEIQD